MKDDKEPPPSPPPPRQQRANSGQEVLKAQNAVTHPLFPYSGDLSISHVARCAGVLFVRANVISSRLFIRPIMFDLELELTVGVGGGRRAKRNLHFPSPNPLLIFDHRLPHATNFLLSPAF